MAPHDAFRIPVWRIQNGRMTAGTDCLLTPTPVGCFQEHDQVYDRVAEGWVMSSGASPLQQAIGADLFEKTEALYSLSLSLLERLEYILSSSMNLLFNNHYTTIHANCLMVFRIGF